MSNNNEQREGIKKEFRNKGTKSRPFHLLEKKEKKYTMPLCHFDSYNLWILKPTHLNRGRGIHVFRDIETLHKLIKQYCQGKELDTFRNTKRKSDTDVTTTQMSPVTKDEEETGDYVRNVKAKVKFNTFIIQKYIEKPLLIHKRKFDIRVWVMLT